MFIALSRSGPGFPPSAAWYSGIPIEHYGAQPDSPSSLQQFQQGYGPGAVQNYPSPTSQGCFPVAVAKMESVVGTLMAL